MVELLERVTRLQKELELKECQEELDVEQVWTTAALHRSRVGCCSKPRSGLQEPVFSGQSFLCMFIVWLCVC